MLNGKLTKGEAERLLKRRHASVLTAFDSLFSEHYIQKENFKHGRGRPQDYYVISGSGLKLLIEEIGGNSLNFWKLLISYYHHSSKQKRGTVHEYVSLFLKKYMKYSYPGFDYQLDIFSNVIENWKLEFIDNRETISREQKILETLAVNRSISLRQLADYTDLSESEIMIVLSKFTLNNFKPLTEEIAYIHQDVIGKRNNKKYWDFLTHCLVKIFDNKDRESNELVFELSIFGIILMLAIIRLQDKDKLKHGLFIEYSFPLYVDSIAINYDDRMPLIFGKWDILKDVLDLYSIYNFDIILDKEIRTGESSIISLTRGGNKELIEGLKEISLHNRNQLGYFARAGDTVFNNYMFDVNYEINNVESKSLSNTNKYLFENRIKKEEPSAIKTLSIKRIIDDMLILLNPVEYGFNNSLITNYSFNDIIEIHEKMMQSEISSLYYIHLYFEFEFDTRFTYPMKHYWLVRNNSNVNPLSLAPKDCLKRILKRDTEEPRIETALLLLFEDIRKFYVEVEGNLSNLTNRIQMV